MKVYQLENESVYLEVNSHGAELVRLKGKKTGKEYLFDADPKYWKRHSPVLFPLVGSLKGKKYTHDGKVYEMSQHGFARDMDFTLKEQSADTLWFSLESSPETLEKYPFAFVLELGYRLKGSCVEVMWRVSNSGRKTMYFSIGAHPAFYCNMTLENGPETDHIHVGDELAGTFCCYHISADGLAVPEDCEVLPCDLAVTADLFARDALIVDEGQAGRLALADPQGREYVVMHFSAPLFGLWSPKSDAPFVCLEPWYGRCDGENFEGVLKDRVHGNTLEPGGVFEAGYTVGLPMEEL